MKKGTRIHTPWLSGNWEGLKGRKLRQKLLERMAGSEVAQEKFWEKAKKGKPDECWEWQGSISIYGYGNCSFYVSEGVRVREQAHRVAYFLQFGMYAGDLCVCHKCDNKLCVNPNHFFLGTHLDNMQDRHTKQRDPRGESNGQAILTESQVRWIKEARGKRMRLRAIAEHVGMSIQTICDITKGRSWKHIQ